MLFCAISIIFTDVNNDLLSFIIRITSSKNCYVFGLLDPEDVVTTNLCNFGNSISAERQRPIRLKH